MLTRPWQVLVVEDAVLVEVNLLVRTVSGEILALDAKIALDDNARFRHARWGSSGVGPSGDPLEAAASAEGLCCSRVPSDGA